MRILVCCLLLSLITFSALAIDPAGGMQLEQAKQAVEQPQLNIQQKSLDADKQSVQTSSSKGTPSDASLTMSQQSMGSPDQAIINQAKQIEQLRTNNTILQDKNQQLATQVQNDLYDQQQMQAQISTAGKAQAGLKADISSLRIRNYHLTQTLKSLQSKMHQGDLSVDKLPSVNKSLISQTTRNIDCAKNGNCTIIRKLPLTEQEKISPQEISDTLHSRYFMPVTVTILIVIIILLVLLLIYSMMRANLRNKNSPAAYGKDEHDFSINEEDAQAISGGDNMAESKLDMARALIEMGEFHAAKEALSEVLASGNEVQRKKAEELLKQVKS